MARDRVFACEECAEEFVVAGSLYACLDWVLRCPCCDSTRVVAAADEELRAVSAAAA
jgi:hypothetical protein